MRSLLGSLLRLVLHLYPFERGKFRILSRVFLPLLAPKPGTPSVTKLSYGLRMKIDPSEFLQAHLYLFGSYELPTIRHIRSFLTPGAVCIDVGAQMGYLSLAMATSAGRQTAVHAFEPEDINAARFRENMALNNIQNVQLHREAVSNIEGTLHLFLSKTANAGTHSTLYNERTVTEESIQIPATTLDAFARATNLPRLDLIKVDVEGAEFEVIQGADSVLRTYRPRVILELCDRLQIERGLSSRQIKEFMVERDYSAYTIADDGTPIPSGLDDPHINDNVLFIPNHDA
jgi:FkbM family methyltransferase